MQLEKVEADKKSLPTQRARHAKQEFGVLKRFTTELDDPCGVWVGQQPDSATSATTGAEGGDSDETGEPAAEHERDDDDDAEDPGFEVSLYDDLEDAETDFGM